MKNQSIDVITILTKGSSIIQYLIYGFFVILLILQSILFNLVEKRNKDTTQTERVSTKFNETVLFLNQFIFWTTVSVTFIESFFIIWSSRYLLMNDILKTLQVFSYRPIKLLAIPVKSKNYENYIRRITSYSTINLLFIMMIVVISRLTNNRTLYNYIIPQYRGNL